MQQAATPASVLAVSILLARDDEAQGRKARSGWLLLAN
jgi:hypothetical protein